MLIDQKLIDSINATIESGYYERNPIRRAEKKSLSESLEKMHNEGRLPIIIEIKCADGRNGQYFSNRSGAIAALEGIGAFAPAAYSAWVEPRAHAGDVKWLSRELPVPVLAKDHYISERQYVGGDAIMLSMPLLAEAKADPHFLIETAHDLDMEVVMEVFTEEHLNAAKKTEADILAINNYGPNGSPASVQTSIAMLKASGTGRPVISMEGITEPHHVRSLVGCGVTAIEVGPKVWASEFAASHLEQLSRAVGGRDPANPIAEIKKVS